MRDPFISTILEHSLPYKLHRRYLTTLHTIMEHSIVAQGLKRVLSFIEPVIQQSSFIRYFQQQHCFMDSFFQHSLLLDGFARLFFSFTRFFALTLQEAFRNTYFHRKSQNIIHEISRYSLRPFAFILFAYLSIYASMRMAFGEGYNRSEVLSIFVLLVFLWLLSHSRIPLKAFTKNSLILAFLKDLVS